MQTQGYNTTAIIMHWLMAVSIFFLFISSWWMLALPFSSEDFRYRVLPFQLHKNVGFTVVIALVVLLYVRFRHRPAPEISPGMRPWMHKMALIDHIILYVLIFACCLSGYMSSSYSGWGTTLWWVMDLPNWGRRDEDLNILYSDIHLWTCWCLLAVVAVHISGAIYHGFRRDGAVRRMLHL